MKNNLVKRIAVLASAVMMGVSLIACGGGGLSDKAYIAKVNEFSSKVESTMNEAEQQLSGVAEDDVDATVELIEGLKAPFSEFAALEAPEKYKEAHAKYQSGCKAMNEMLDTLIEIAKDGEDVDPSVIDKFEQAYTTMVTDFTEADSMMMN